MKELTARGNPQVKAAIALKQRKTREREGKILVEGVRLVEDARSAGVKILSLFMTKEFVSKERGAALAHACQGDGIKCYLLPPEVFAYLTSTETPQGVVAIAQVPQCDLAQVISGDGLLLVADRVQDPGNLGTMIRTAAGAGCRGVVLAPGTVDPYSGKVLRASMGSAFRLPVVIVADLKALLQELKTAGYCLVGGTAHTDRVYWDTPLRQPGALVVGNEAWGIDSELLELMDHKVKIPVAHGVESLNVAMAAGVILYEWVRQTGHHC